MNSLDILGNWADVLGLGYSSLWLAYDIDLDNLGESNVTFKSEYLRGLHINSVVINS